MVYSFTSADCEVFLQTDRQKPRLVSSTGLEEMEIEVRVLYFSKQRTPQPLSHLLNRLHLCPARKSSCPGPSQGT